MVLGTAFSDQADVLVAETNFSAAGTFTPRALPARTLPTGVAVLCRVAIQRTDPRIPKGDAGVRSPGWSVLLNQREIPDMPRKGDEIAITEGPELGSYLVMSIEESGFSRYWTVHVRKVPA